MTPGAPRLRVALAADWFLPRLGGIELHLADLARALGSQGHAAHVLTTTPGPAEMDGVAVRRVSALRAPGFGFAVAPSLVRTLRKELSIGRYDVVHAHVSVVSPLGYAAIFAARSLGLPTVVTFHSVLLAKAHILRLADHLLGWSRWPIVVSAVSPLVASQLRRANPGLDVTVLPNGVDPERWRATPPQDRGRGTTVVVTAMRLNRKKRPLALLQAFRQAHAAAASHQRRLVLRIAGEGPERAKLARYIARHRLGDDVALLGALSRDALRTLYANADLFVLPSVRESFGIVALEARCAGLPVIAMRAGGAAEFLRHDETALLAANDDELASHLARLVLDDALRSRLAAPDTTLERFAWPAVIGAHLACYERAMALTRRG